jgi:hypothetical protein
MFEMDYSSMQANFVRDGNKRLFLDFGKKLALLATE